MDLAYAYDTLLLPFGSPLEKVKHAFYAEAQIVHPDKLSDMPANVVKHAEERFKQLNEAYRTLNEYITANGVPTPRKAKEPAWDAQPLHATVNTEPDPEKVPPPSGRSAEEAMGAFMVGEMRRHHSKEEGLFGLNQFSYWKIYLIIFALSLVFRHCAFDKPRHQPKILTPDTTQSSEQTP